MSHLVSIHSLRGRLAGSGVIVNDVLVLTCAHVVNSALDRPSESSERPNEQHAVKVQFNGAPGRSVRATVDSGDEAWSAPPADSRKGADLCLLKLENPAPNGATVARLEALTFVQPFDARASGYPSDWNESKVQDPQLDVSQGRVLSTTGHLWLMRVDYPAILASSLRNPSRFLFSKTDVRGVGMIYTGFSGGPVETLDCVVGIVAQSREAAAEGTSYIIPATNFPKRILHPQELVSTVQNVLVRQERLHPSMAEAVDPKAEVLAGPHRSNFAREGDKLIFTSPGRKPVIITGEDLERLPDDEKAFIRKAQESMDQVEAQWWDAVQQRNRARSDDEILSATREQLRVANNMCSDLVLVLRTIGEKGFEIEDHWSRQRAICYQASALLIALTEKG